MKKILTVIAVVLLFSSCAQKKVDQVVDNKLAQTPNITGPRELNQDTSNTIATAPGLTDDQRSKLTVIHRATEEKLSKLREESLKLRELLTQEVVRTENYNDNQVNRIKSRLKDVESKRLTTLFKAIDQANDVLGHQTQRTQVMNAMMRMDNYDRDYSATQGR